MLHRFANPTRFLRLADTIRPWAGWLTLILLAAGLYFALFDSPPDYQQGESVRIMYVHVPAAWMGMFAYAGMAAASGVALVWKHPVADLWAKVTAPLGAAFTFLALLSGSLWGKPMWGTYWVWDARLTSMLILFFLYLGYIALRGAFDDPERGAKAAAVLSLVGVINLPIIKFSVDWWNTLHQPESIFRAGGPTIDPRMLLPLFLMALAFTAYYVWFGMLRMRAEIVGKRAQALARRQAEEAEFGTARPMPDESTMAGKVTDEMADEAAGRPAASPAPPGPRS